MCAKNKYVGFLSMEIVEVLESLAVQADNSPFPKGKGN